MLNEYSRKSMYLQNTKENDQIEKDVRNYYQNTNNGEKRNPLRDMHETKSMSNVLSFPVDQPYSDNSNPNDSIS